MCSFISIITGSSVCVNIYLSFTIDTFHTTNGYKLVITNFGCVVSVLFRLICCVFIFTMNYCYVIGLSGKNELLYIDKEKCLYMEHSQKNGKKYFQCYQGRLKSSLDYVPCPARCNVDQSTKIYTRTNGIHNHKNHELEFNDLKSLNAMKDKCRWLADSVPLYAYKISVKEIFLEEMAKLVLLF